MKKYEFYEEEFLSALGGALEINSTNGDCGPVSEKAPLGEGVYNALEYARALGEKMGFRTKMLDGKAVWIEAGEGERLVGVLAHMDTVPVNVADWASPPHALTLKDGYIYGRGAADNKGPAILSLFALRAIVEAGDLSEKRLRIILGGDEELPSWRCMARYKETEEIPSLSFSPDGRYPVTYAEKGILQLALTAKNAGAGLEMQGGAAWNVVPHHAEAAFGGKKYTADGKAAHAAAPHMGDNALTKLAEKLREAGCGHPLARLLGIADLDGFDIRLEDAESGALTINPAIVRCGADLAELCCDIRIPVTFTAEEVVARIAARVAPLGFEIEERYYSPPLYVPRDSELVVKLQSVYREMTGRDDEAVASGGSTYAKAFPNAVAFGAGFGGESSNIHDANERWSLESARLNFQIIANAMAQL